MPALKISICRKTGEVLSKEYIDDSCTPDIDGLARVIAQQLIEKQHKEKEG